MKLFDKAQNFGLNIFQKPKPLLQQKIRIRMTHQYKNSNKKLKNLCPISFCTAGGSKNIPTTFRKPYRSKIKYASNCDMTYEKVWITKGFRFLLKIIRNNGEPFSRKLKQKCKVYCEVSIMFGSKQFVGKKDLPDQPKIEQFRLFTECFS